MKNIILKRAFCLLAIFVAYQIFQVNTYSSEHHVIELIKPSANNLPFLSKIDNGSFISYEINPYYRYAFKEKIRNSTNKIYSTGVLNETHLANFLNAHNSEIKYLDAKTLAASYIRQCKNEGVNHDIAFAQMCLETGYLKFGGSVLPNQNNFCGLGAVNENCSGETFASKEIGILAHVQHLKAYASTDELNSPIVDTRFKYVKRGSVKTIFDLTGKWASDPEYGEKIENLLHRMYAI